MITRSKSSKDYRRWRSRQLLAVAMKLGYKAEDVLHAIATSRGHIEEISRWLSAERLPAYSDEQIIQFLLSCDDVVETTKKTIKTYVEMTNGLDEIFSNRNIRRIDLQKQLNVGEICVAPARTDNNEIVMFYRLVDTNHLNYEMGPDFTLCSMIIEAAYYEYPAKGLITVVDASVAGWRHLTRMRTDLLRSFSVYLQEAQPVKLRRLCVINARPILVHMLNLLKGLVKTDVMNRIVVYKTDEMGRFFEECVPRRLMPVDYGGETPCLRVLQTDQVEKLKVLSEHFRDEERQRKCSDST